MAKPVNAEEEKIYNELLEEYKDNDYILSIIYRHYNDSEEKENWEEAKELLDWMVEYDNQKKKYVPVNYNIVYSELLKLAKKYYYGKDDEECDYEKAFSLFYYLAVNDDEEGQYYAGYMLEKGLGIKQDYLKAFDLYKKASENGDCYAKVRLARLYDIGKGIKQDFSMAAKLYLEALEIDSCLSLGEDDFCIEVRLGEMYEKGEGVEQDIDKAISLYSEYVEYGWDSAAEGLLRIANLYKNGIGVEKNIEKAMEIYLKVVKVNTNGKAEFEIAQIYNDDGYDGKSFYEAIKWYERASFFGHDIAEQKLNIIYDNILLSSNDAVELYELGNKFEKGLFVDINDIKAFQCFMKSANNDCNDKALCKVGKCYLYGFGTDLNYLEAKKWLEKSAIQENAEALNFLGYIFRYGLGVVKDNVKAIELFKKSALKFNVNAFNNLLDMCKDGLCSESDKVIIKAIKKKTIIENHKRLLKSISNDKGIYLYDSDFVIFKKVIDNILNTLSSRENEVLILRFGLKDGKRRSFEEVGKHFGVTRERIRQIEAKALRRMRSKSAISHFDELLKIKNEDSLTKEDDNVLDD